MFGTKQRGWKSKINSDTQMDVLDGNDSIFFSVYDPLDGTTCKTVNPLDVETVGMKSALIKFEERYGMTSKCVASNYQYPSFRKDFIFISP